MTKAVFLIAGLAGLMSTTGAFAGPVTPEEEKYCAYNYREYCN